MAVADVLSGALPESAHRSQLRRAVIASTVGTTIEWYDFLLYSVVTGLVFGNSLHGHNLKGRISQSGGTRPARALNLARPIT
jgi:hypothetical protein